VGYPVEGNPVGEFVGIVVVGCFVGSNVGYPVEGNPVGEFVGVFVVGCFVG
jgi:hypothetical protein